MPYTGECVVGTVPSDVVGSGCSWSRTTSQHFVTGSQLRDMGLDTSGAEITPSQLAYNDAIMRDTFALHKGRCCGC